MSAVLLEQAPSSVYPANWLKRPKDRWFYSMRVIADIAVGDKGRPFRWLITHPWVHVCGTRVRESSWELKPLQTWLISLAVFVMHGNFTVVTGEVTSCALLQLAYNHCHSSLIYFTFSLNLLSLIVRHMREWTELCRRSSHVQLFYWLDFMQDTAAINAFDKAKTMKFTPINSFFNSHLLIRNKADSCLKKGSSLTSQLQVTLLEF